MQQFPDFSATRLQSYMRLGGELLGHVSSPSGLLLRLAAHLAKILLELLTQLYNIYLVSYAFKYFDFKSGEPEPLLAFASDAKIFFAIMALLLNMAITHLVFAPTLKRLRDVSPRQRLAYLGLSSVASVPVVVTTLYLYNDDMPYFGGERSKIFRPIFSVLAYFNTVPQVFNGMVSLRNVLIDLQKNWQDFWKKLAEDFRQRPWLTLLLCVGALNALYSSVLYLVVACVGTWMQKFGGFEYLLTGCAAIGGVFELGLFGYFTNGSYQQFQHCFRTETERGNSQPRIQLTRLKVLLASSIVAFSGFVFADQTQILVDSLSDNKRFLSQEATYAVQALGFAANFFMTLFVVIEVLVALERGLSRVARGCASFASSLHGIFSHGRRSATAATTPLLSAPSEPSVTSEPSGVPSNSVREP